MKKFINNAKIEGRLYQHNLAIRQVQNEASANFGKNFISGEIEVAVDEEGLNVIPVHFTYVTETTAKGQKSPTYSVLENIIEGAPTWINDGKDHALKVRIDTAIALNDFYNSNNELVSAKRLEGGFVTIVNGQLSDKDRNSFSADMVITSVKHVDEDPEKSVKEHCVLHGAIFDFKNALLPVDFVVENPQGMNYFEGLNASASEPAFTKVWGNIICETIVVEQREESAFGEAAVRAYTRKNKSWVVSGTAAEAYEFGEENTITADELKQAIQDRNVYLASVKTRAEEYKNSKKAAPAAAPAKKGSWNF